MKIAIDAMGGDDAPKFVIDGTALAVRRDPSIKPILVGDKNRLMPLIKKHKNLSDVEVVHTESKVSGDELPSTALRSGRDSSMRIAIDLVKENLADAVVSAGNTGALMMKALVVLRTVDGVDRPAMAAYFPSKKEQVCILDLGANVECSSANLVQFAALGDAFCRVTLGIKHPKIGLLNVGEEENKGKVSIKEAAMILSGPTIELNYVGFAEGNDILSGQMDVIVSDGFSGNVALKTAEGVSHFISSMLKQAFRATFFSRLGYLLVWRSLRQMRNKINPQRYNGAVMLGLNGIVVKSHGNATAVGFANAIKVASDMHSNDFMTDLKICVKRSLRAIESAALENQNDK